MSFCFHKLRFGRPAFYQIRSGCIVCIFICMVYCSWVFDIMFVVHSFVNLVLPWLVGLDGYDWAFSSALAFLIDERHQLTSRWKLMIEHFSDWCYSVLNVARLLWLWLNLCQDGNMEYTTVQLVLRNYILHLPVSSRVGV